jgi:hypothetical protein
MKYKRKETKNGRVQYWATDEHDKYKMIAFKDIPEDVQKQLETETEVDTNTPQVSDHALAIKPEDRKCFIDGEPGKYKKFLEQQTVYLCDEHQHSLTTGEVVYYMRQKGLFSDKDKEDGAQ